MNRIFFKTNTTGVTQLSNQSGRYWKVKSWPAHSGTEAVAMAHNVDTNISDYLVEDHFKAICDAVGAVFERLTYDEAITYGKTIRPDRQVENIDGQMVDQVFDFELDDRDIASHFVFEGTSLQGNGKVDTKVHDLLNILAGYVIIKQGDATEVKIDKKDGAEFTMNTSNATQVILDVMTHISIGKSKRKNKEKKT